MNLPADPEFQSALSNAWSALKHKDFAGARYWAQTAARLSPESEDPWLILAAISSPDASVAYLEHALELNPQNPHAQEGLHWAKERAQKASAEKQETGASVAPAPTSPASPKHSPTWFSSPAITTSPAASVPASSVKPATPARKRGSWALLVVLIMLAAAAVLAWFAVPRLVAAARSSAAPIQANQLGKPTLTPTNTPTLTPTLTPTPTPTFTPTPTATNTPTATKKPTKKPTRTPRVEPTDEVPIYPTEPPIIETGRWIDVDLSNQVLYAYVDDTIVASFLVSTGTYLHPTVTGQYNIYVKYRYTDMKGEGYYLPDVPYTMYFYQGYGIHGTYWHHNFGTPMSHGCINMRTEDAEWLFYWASVGTLVNIHY